MSMMMMMPLSNDAAMRILNKISHYENFQHRKNRIKPLNEGVEGGQRLIVDRLPNTEIVKMDTIQAR